jgi:hypothetical protein
MDWYKNGECRSYGVELNSVHNELFWLEVK